MPRDLSVVCRQFEQIGNLNFNLGRLAGPGLLDPIHASIGHNPFGRGLTGIFGRQVLLIKLGSFQKSSSPERSLVAGGECLQGKRG